MSAELYNKTASELSALLAKGEVSSREVVTAFIQRTEATDGKLRAFNSYDAEDALRQAEEADERRANGRRAGALDGIPVAMKDAIAVKGQPLTCSSKMLASFRSPYDAHCIELLRREGAIIWGRLNLDEFAMGSSTENSAFAATANPWDLQRVPGGSSGGCAAAVAARQVPLSLGSDTGGSIRQPAAFCGVVGVKPTYGMVSRYGLAAFASSLDQIGPIARTVEDAALLLKAISGHDTRDSTSARREAPDYVQALRAPHQKKWRLGIPQEYLADTLSAETRDAVEKVIAYYREQGHEVVPVSLPHTELAVPVYYIIATAEASSNMARYDGVRYTHRSERVTDANDLYSLSRSEGFGPEVKRRIILGTYVLSSGYYDAYYLKAQKIRTLIRQDFTAAFESVDALLTPVTQGAAFLSGEKNTDLLAMYLNDVFTISANLAGLPAMSMPCGFTKDGLPLGYQLIGPAFAEADLLSIAAEYEKAHPQWQRMPAALA